MTSSERFTLDEFQYKLAHLRNQTTIVIQDSWKEVDDLKQVNADYDTKIQTLQKKLEAIQSMQKNKLAPRSNDDEYVDDFGEICSSNLENSMALPCEEDDNTVVASSTLSPEKDSILSKLPNSSSDQLNGSLNIFNMFKQDRDKKSSDEKTIKADSDKNAKSTFDSVGSASTKQYGSVHDVLRHALLDIETENKAEEKEKTIKKNCRGRSTIETLENSTSSIQISRRRASYGRNSFSSKLPPPKESDKIVKPMESLSFSSTLDQGDDMEEEMVRIEQYSHIEGCHQGGEKLAERLKARLEHKEDSLITLRKCVEGQSHEIKQLNYEIAEIHSNFAASKQKLKDECIEIRSQITNNYNIDASLERSCLELESQLEQMRAQENFLMQELSEINQKENCAQLQDAIYIKSLQKKLQVVNDKRNLSEKEVEDMKTAASTVFRQLQSSLHKVLLQKNKNVEKEQIQHRKKLIKKFIKSCLKVREKESLLAKKLSNRLQHRKEIDEILEEISKVKDSLQGFLVLLKEVHFNVCESLIYVQRSPVENANDDDENSKPQDGLYRDHFRLLSFQPSMKYHTLATTTCLETSIDYVTTILFSLSVVEEELQNQLSMLQSGQYPKNNETSLQKDTNIIDNTDVLRKAEQATQKAAQCIVNVENTISIQLKELSEKALIYSSPSSVPLDEESSSQTEKPIIKSQDEIIEELESKLDFENAILVALKRSTHQDKQSVKALERDFLEMQSYAEKEFKFHLQSLENIQGKTDFIKDNMNKNSGKIDALEEEYSLRKEEECRLRRDLDEVRRKAKMRAPCVPFDLSHTIL